MSDDPTKLLTPEDLEQVVRAAIASCDDKPDKLRAKLNEYIAFHQGCRCEGPGCAVIVATSRALMKRLEELTPSLPGIERTGV